MKKACLLVGIAIMLASPAMADQKTVVLRMIHNPDHIGPAIPTGYEVDRRPIEPHVRSHHHHHHWVKRYLHAHG
jgi:hypothetical protein